MDLFHNFYNCPGEQSPPNIAAPLLQPLAVFLLLIPYNSSLTPSKTFFNPQNSDKTFGASFRHFQVTLYWYLPLSYMALKSARKMLLYFPHIFRP